MMNWKDTCTAVGFHESYTVPRPVVKYLAYFRGTCRGFDNNADALAYSPLVEKVIANEGEIAAAKERNDVLYSKAVKLFVDNLREEHRHLSDEVYDVCYAEAWDRGHSAGYDEVASELCSAVNFAERILAAK